MNDHAKNISYEDIVKKLLAEHVGLEVSDITEDDSFLEDLHMKPTEFADFLEELATQGLDTETLDLSSIQTVGDLIESLSSHIYTA